MPSSKPKKVAATTTTSSLSYKSYNAKGTVSYKNTIFVANNSEYNSRS